jgi:hypothetical protein
MHYFKEANAVVEHGIGLLARVSMEAGSPQRVSRICKSAHVFMVALLMTVQGLPELRHVHRSVRGTKHASMRYLSNPSRESSQEQTELHVQLRGS